MVLGPANAKGISLIRDAEIENTIRAYAAPLFAQAGLDPAAVRVHLVKDRALNAFVAGGQRIFIHTGLLLASDTPNQVIGVIAHETGHITGGHLARTQDALSGVTAQSIVAMVLGAAAIVAGQPAAGAGIIAGGQQVAERSFLKYSRIQEGAADQAGLAFLEQTQQSARGLMEFLGKFGDQEALLTANQDPYVRTHPLSRDRLETVRHRVEISAFSDRKDSEALQRAHDRMKAKLTGFLESPGKTFRIYPLDDLSVPARYARAVAYHRQRKFAEALAEVESLIAEQPDDPFFHELKGQFLLETGKIDEAIGPYTEAVRIYPGSTLLRSGLGQAQASARSNTYIDDAIENLRIAVRDDPQNASAWRWLATAYGRNEQIGMAALATAERYILVGNNKDAARQAGRALRTLSEGTAAHLRAQDLQQAANDKLKKKKN